MDNTVLAERVCSLERRNTVLMILSLSLLVLILVGAGRGGVSETTRPSDRMLIRDAQNNIRLELGIAANHPFMALYDPQGKRRAELSLGLNDEPSLKFLSGNGTALVELWGSETGAGLNFSDKSGKTWLSLLTSYDEGVRQIALLSPTPDGKSAAMTGFTVADNGPAEMSLNKGTKGFIDMEIGKDDLPDFRLMGGSGLEGIEEKVDAGSLPHLIMTRKDGTITFEKP